MPLPSSRHSWSRMASPSSRASLTWAWRKKNWRRAKTPTPPVLLLVLLLVRVQAPGRVKER